MCGVGVLCVFVRATETAERTVVIVSRGNFVVLRIIVE